MEELQKKAGRKKNSLSALTKRKNQLTRQLISGMMDCKINGKNTPGLLSKLMKQLDGDLASGVPELRDRAMDKIIKLMPLVVSKERAPAVQLNVQNNSQHISAGKSTTLAIGTINEYLKKRSKKMNRITDSQIEDAEIVEAPKTLEIEYEEEDSEEESEE